MILTNIKLHNFRCAKEADIGFTEGVNLLHGKNAQGKTNVLEAIYFFARGKSFRGGKDADMLRFGESGYSMQITFTRTDGEHTLEYRYFDGQRLRLANGVKVPAREMIGKFNAVFFCPDHLSIIKASPSVRREFLNIALSQLSGAYVTHLAAHKKLTEQNNPLLKQEIPYDRALMAAYNREIAEHSAEIYLARRFYVQKLSESVCKTVSEISDGRENVAIEYHSDLPDAVCTKETATLYYQQLFTASEAREAAAKMCLVGIQRDDLVFTIGGHDAKQFASQGQQRSLALALKLGEGEIITAEKGEAPVYLFDDVLGELDEDRKNYVLSRTEGRQMIVTACETGDYLHLSDVNMIEVSEGEYKNKGLLSYCHPDR